MSNKSFEQYPKSIKLIIKQNQKIRKKCQQTRAPCDKANLNKITKHLKEKLVVYRYQSFNNFVSNLSLNDHLLWKTTKHFKTCTILGLGIILEKLIFCKYFETVFTPRLSTVNPYEDETD